MNNNGEQLVFIGGSPRSGTSLLQKMLDLHSEVYAGPEFDHIPAIVRLFKGMLNGVENKRQEGYYNSADIHSRFREFMQSIFETTRLKSGAKLLSEKTPSNVLVFEGLIELFPKSKFIFVVRDPRGIYNSFKMVGQRAKKQKISKVNYGVNLKSDLDRISSHLAAGDSFVEAYPKQSLVVVYEELVNKPDVIIKQVCDFLDISYESNMLNTQKQNESSRLIRDGGGHVSPFYTKEIYDRKVDASSSVKWTLGLNWMEQNTVAYFFQKKNIKNLQQYNLTDSIGVFAKIHLSTNRIFSFLKRRIFN